jgi:Ca2+-binding RTX toxin-like protein
MILGTVTHFSQGWNTSMLTSAEAIGATSIRDSISWGTIETSPGVYDFSDARVAYVQTAIAMGMDVTLVFSSTNALYDGGATPNTPEGLEAYANFIKAALSAFPGVAAVEIGNEFNGNNFVSGEVLTDGYSQRDEHYMDILSVVSETISDAFPDVKILGGAAHSVPVGYLTELFNKGALDMVDGVTIHPYTTAPEQLGDQLEILKAAMGDHQVPIYVTEFGQNFTSLDDAPAYLLKMTAVMAEAGVASADWYALQEQKWFPNMELVDRSGAATPAGKAFEFIQETLLDLGAPKDISPDSASYFYQFGDRTVVMWGEDQTVTFSAGTKFYTATGQLIENFDGKVHSDEPIVAVSNAPVVPGQTFFTSGTGIVADSYHDFDVSNAAGSAAGYEGPWSYYQLSGTGKMAALYTMSGGARADEPWTPYIGTTALRPLRLDATSVNPVDFSNGTSAAARYAIVERFTVKTADRLTIDGHWDVSDKSTDGIDLTIVHNGKTIYHSIVYDPSNGNVLDLVLNGIDVQAGDVIDFIVGSNKTSGGGDTTERHITIRSENWSEHALLDAAAKTVIGGTTDDMLHGGLGNDLLDGLQGADSMAGGLGDDTYIVDNVRDITVEAKNAGSDTVKSSVSFSLAGQYVEKLVLTGTDDIDGTGNSLDNTITGNAGSNVINGGTGADTMAGGSGSDTYFVDNAGDKVVEADVSGADTVNSSITFSLAGQYVEKLTLTGPAAINGTGNSLNNDITGNAGVNTLTGGKGNDDYYVQTAGDKVVELDGQGLDRVYSTVSFSLAGQYIERLGLQGSGNINGTGNSLDNSIVGNSGDNVIDGGKGADRIAGGAGRDTFVFSTALGSPNVDVITDFKAVDDTFRLDDAVFKGLTVGNLSADAFYAGTAAHDASDRIIYNVTTGALFFDRDGAGSTYAAVQFATLENHATVSHADFVVV